MRSRYAATCRGCIFPIGCSVSALTSFTVEFVISGDTLSSDLTPLRRTKPNAKRAIGRITPIREDST